MIQKYHERKFKYILPLVLPSLSSSSPFTSSIDDETHCEDVDGEESKQERKELEENCWVKTLDPKTIKEVYSYVDRRTAKCWTVKSMRNYVQNKKSFVHYQLVALLELLVGLWWNVLKLRREQLVGCQMCEQQTQAFENNAPCCVSSFSVRFPTFGFLLFLTLRFLLVVAGFPSES